jgi:DNA-binding transcriptional LysR family regulator
MKDLNNLRLFASIVEHGSLTAASESLGVAKSMLSRHLSSFEKELGVQLIRRTSRRLQVTDIGKRYYEQCRVILDEVARASSIPESVRTLPRGRLRISCPLNFAQSALAPILGAFMARFPDVELVLATTNDAVASIREGHDVALHIGPAVKSRALVTSSFAVDREVLLASPALLSRIGIPRAPADLRAMPSAAGQHPPDPGGRHMWHLTGPGNARLSVQHVPRLVTEDLWVIRESALAGCAVVSLPPVLCRDVIDEGRLIRILPGWALAEQRLHVMYQSRQGLTAAARALLDFLSTQLRSELRSLQDSTLQLALSPYRKRDRLSSPPGASQRSQRG